MAVVAVSTQCTNVTAIQPDRHRTTTKAALMHSVGQQNCRKCEGQHELLGCRLEMRGLQEQREKLHECVHRSLLATSVLCVAQWKRRVAEKPRVVLRIMEIFCL